MTGEIEGEKNISPRTCESYKQITMSYVSIGWSENLKEVLDRRIYT